MNDERQSGAPVSELSNTRAGRREEVQAEKQVPQNRKRKADGTENKETRWVQIRLFPIWLRIILVLILIGAAAAAGLAVGYGIIGDGQPMDALKMDTWKHILDMIQGKES